MAETAPADVEWAAKELCRAKGIPFSGLDWARVAEVSCRLDEAEQWALSLFCEARGEYARTMTPAGVEYDRDESGQAIWHPGTGDFEPCRWLFREMGLIRCAAEGEEAR